MSLRGHVSERKEVTVMENSERNEVIVDAAVSAIEPNDFADIEVLEDSFALNRS